MSLSGNMFDLTISNNDIVHIKIIAPNGTQIQFKLNKQSTFEQMINYYCMRQCINVIHMQFLYIDRFISANETPYSIGMKDHSIIKSSLKSHCV